MSIVSCKPTITRKELEGVLDCLINEDLLTGTTVKLFEGQASRHTGIKYALAVNSLTAAYHLAFKALEIAPGDEIIIPSYFDIAPLSAADLIGATPVLVDIEQGALAPSTSQIKEKITEKTKAIVFGHTFGFLTPLEELAELGVPIVEDISHAIGGTLENDAPVGGGGAIAVASFAASMVITTGNGGMALTRNSRLYARMKELRGNGGGEHLHFDYCMTDFQGAMGISQLARLEGFIYRRREIARSYYDALKLTPHKAPYHFNEQFVYQSFPIIFDAPADKVEKYWKKNSIEVFHPVETPLHRYLGAAGHDYPHSDRASRKVYGLPIFPTLTRREIDKITTLLARFI